MTDFKSKFIYPVFVLRLLLLIVLSGALLVFIFMGIPSLAKQHSGLKAFALISLGLLVFGYFLFLLGRSAFTQRYSILIHNRQTMLHDNIFGRHIALDEKCKGFSLSGYGNRGALYDFKTLIFYFSDGRKIELPQFLYSNFKDIMPSLKEGSVKFLGQEPYQWKNLFSRRYYFD